MLLRLILLAFLCMATATTIRGELPDPRHIANGSIIPDEGYCDQPYVVPTADGAWLCVLTTAAGHEGTTTQHVIALRSRDYGKTWSPPVGLEPAGAPENSYAVLLRAPSDRVFCFYNYNTANLREVRAENGQLFKRVDTLGDYVFRYSDDHGQTWSGKRYVVPVREFDCDRANTYAAKVRFFWNVGRPCIVGAAAYVPLHKVGAFGEGFLAQSEGVFLRSTNILHEPDPEKIQFDTLPDGRIGLRAPPGGGRIAEEQSLVSLSDGTLYCVYRSTSGHPIGVYSTDAGHTWTPPAVKTYLPGGRPFKHPRAANFVWRCSNGQFLYWFHNHGGRSYEDRNPAWLCAGREVDTPAGKRLAWSQPEIILYDDDPLIRMSYPDLIEANGEFFLTETQKEIGRVHRLDAALLAGLFGQWTNAAVARKGLLLELPGSGPLPRQTALPNLPVFIERDPHRFDMAAKDNRAGFTLELWLKPHSLAPGQVLLQNRSPDGRGFVLSTSDQGACNLSLSDGRTVSTWSSDAGILTTNRLHHVVAIVDGGPKVISYVIDGLLCDGGTQRQFGWGRFSPHLQHVNGHSKLSIGQDFAGEIQRVRIYNRALRTSEAAGNFRAGL